MRIELEELLGCAGFFGHLLLAPVHEVKICAPAAQRVAQVAGEVFARSRHCSKMQRNVAKRAEAQSSEKSYGQIALTLSKVAHTTLPELLVPQFPFFFQFSFQFRIKGLTIGMLEFILNVY